MNNGPLVTAILTTFRRPQLLPRALASMFAQTWRPLEVIAVDDGSGDETPRVLAGFEAQAREAGVQYSWVTKANEGPGLARNEGMKRGKGDYFAFLDDDDEWRPDKTSLQVAALRKTPDAGACFGRIAHPGREDRPKPAPDEMKTGWVFPSLCDGSTRAYVVALMITRKAFEATGGFGPERNWEDTEFELRLALNAPFVSVPDVVCTVHPGESSVSREAGLEGDLERDRLKLRMLDTFIQANRRRPRFDEAATAVLRARIYDEHIKHLVWLGRVDQARAAWHEAIAACGEQPILRRLRGKLLRARVAGWLGMKLRKP